MRAALIIPAVQIITVNESGDGFTLHAEKVRHVLKQVPADCKVAVVSVVGAFRTGKSFLLDMMLRYLRYYEEHPDGESCGTFHTDAAWLVSICRPLIDNVPFVCCTLPVQPSHRPRRTSGCSARMPRWRASRTVGQRQTTRALASRLVWLARLLPLPRPAVAAAGAPAAEKVLGLGTQLRPLHLTQLVEQEQAPAPAPLGPPLLLLLPRLRAQARVTVQCALASNGVPVRSAPRRASGCGLEPSFAHCRRARPQLQPQPLVLGRASGSVWRCC